MPRRPIVLVVTLALNATLLGALFLRPTLAPPAMRDWFERTPGRASATSAQSASSAAPGRADSIGAATKEDTAPTLWSILATDDLRSLVAQLKAAGFPPRLVRAIVEARLADGFNARARELLASLGFSETLEYWKPDPLNGPGNQKYWEQQSQIYRDRARMLRELLGTEYLAASYGTSAEATKRWSGSIPQQKMDQIQRVMEDYSEMNSQLRSSMQGITLPEDQEKLALLERERRADIVALLTPEELADYDMRNSRITGRLRPALTLLDANEEEFQRIYQAWSPYIDRVMPTTRDFNSGADAAEKQREAQRELNTAVKASLGDQRYADYVRAMTPEFQQLNRIAQRENVPTDAAVRAFGLRDTVSAESNRIFEDPTLNNEQRRAALAALAQNTRAQMTTILGVNAGRAYSQLATWVGNVETGRAVNFTDGTATYRRVGTGTTNPNPSR